MSLSTGTDVCHQPNEPQDPPTRPEDNETKIVAGAENQGEELEDDLLPQPPRGLGIPHGPAQHPPEGGDLRQDIARRDERPEGDALRGEQDLRRYQVSPEDHEE